MNNIVYTPQVFAMAFLFFFPPVYTVCSILHCSNCFQLTVTHNTGNYYLFEVTQPLQQRWLCLK